MQKRPFFIFIFLFPLCLAAQVFTGSEAAKIVPGSETIRVSPHTGQLSYIRFQPDTQFTLQDFLLQPPGWLPPSVKPSDLQPIQTETDHLGITHTRHQVYHQGIPIETSVLIVHSQNGVIQALNGELFPHSIPAVPTISAAQALQKALDFSELSSRGLHHSPQGTLAYVPQPDPLGPPAIHLAWKFDIHSLDPLYRAWVFVDAHTGEIVRSFNRIHATDVPGTAVTRYSGTQSITTDSIALDSFRLRESGRGGGILTLNMDQDTAFLGATDFWDTDNLWNNVNLFQDEVATDVHFATEQTYDYFLNTHNWNSFDNQGAPLTSYVHFRQNFPSAFWDGSGFVYGDGDGDSTSLLITDPLTSVDICAHEITHAFTEHSSGLIYYDQSGALNESFSDIFGTVVEAMVRPNGWNWLGGEDANRGVGIRSLADPTLFQDPDTYFGTYWHTTYDDNRGVHTNSGVQNKWFYILTAGETGVNDNGDAYSVTGIGMAAAAQIAFRNNSMYLTPASNYDDARFYAIQAAKDLFGDCSNEMVQTTNAWYAVGVGDAYTLSPTAGFNTYLYDYCSVPASVSFTDLSTFADAYYWDFGDGITDTSASPTHVYTQIGTYDVTLVVTGCTGMSDTLFRPQFIRVDTTIPCPTIMDTTGITTVFDCEGTLLDPGGQWDYPNYSNATFTISPTGAAQVQLNFSEFDLQAPQDYVRVYDGPNTLSPLLGFYLGSNLPNGGTVMSSGSSITLTFYSDAAITAPGFELDWQCVPLNSAPIAQFTTPSQLSCNGRMAFEDQSLGPVTSWLWNFGDGSTANVQSPVHQYASPGTYTVSLIACNGTLCDTITQSQYVTYSSANNCAYIMPPGDSLFLTDCSGTLLDPGGVGNYPNNSYSRVTISPPGATHIYLDFSSFATEDFTDGLQILDGPSVNSPQIGQYFGNTLPMGGQVVSTGGSVTLVFTSNILNPDSGFHLDWQCLSPSDPPYAQFAASPLYNCDGIVGFSNQSQGAVSNYMWDFGDGSTSALLNPTHAYAGSGDYTAILIACNANGCDTATRPNYIHVDTLGLCPTAMDTSMHQFFTQCSGTLLDPGGTGLYPPNAYAVTTIAPPNASTIDLYIPIFNLRGLDKIRIYDGASINSPLLVEYVGGFSNNVFPAAHQSSGGAVTIEFWSDATDQNPGFELNWSCNTATTPPVAAFSGFPLLSCDGQVSFQDLTAGGNSTWLWDFGDGNIDSVATPSHIYAAPGTYDVQLITCNPMGCDTLIQPSFITFDSMATCTTLMPVQGTVTYTDCSGILLDPGGLERYPNNCQSVVTLSPGNAVAVTLQFSAFQHQWADPLKIYDGPSVNSPLIGTYANWVLPNGGTITSSTGAITLEFTSDQILADSGFVLTWDCTPSTQLPVTDFAAYPLISCNGQVDFTDLNPAAITQWLWDFGDGNMSTLQNPSHTYANPGTYSVTLITCNNIGCDTLVRPNYVTVDTTATCQNLFPTFGTHTLTDCQGTLLDAGGINDYPNGSAGLLTLAPPGAGSLTLQFQLFQFGARDTLTLFDGPDSLSPIIGQYSSGNPPPMIPFSSSAGTVSVLFESDGTLNGPGFELDWSCLPATAVPVSQFTVDTTLSCDGIHTFTDQSLANPTFWRWLFGDGTDSNAQHPTHAYSGSGTFSVTLITCNANGCDTLVQPNLIVVDTSLICPVAMPLGNWITLTDCQGYLQDPGGAGPYPPFSTGRVTIAPTNATQVDLNFSSFDLETGWDYLRIYDGPSVSSPLIGSFTGISLPNGGLISSSGSSLTLEFLSNGTIEWSGFEAQWNCNLIQPLVADFTALPLTTCNGFVEFSDLSSPPATNVWWDFGDGSISVLPSPTHIYTNSGTYSVSLRACNPVNCDTLVRQNYLTVDLDGMGCDTVTLAPVGEAFQYRCRGTVLDAGGTGDYANDMNTQMVIAPPGANGLVLNFTQFDLEPGADFLSVYDGSSTSSPLIGTFSGNTLPNAGNIHASGSALTLVHTTNSTVTAPGFAADWVAFGSNQGPRAVFVPAPGGRANDPLAFSDFSTNAATWTWDFGDGNGSVQQNPTHTYSAAGTYLVALEVTDQAGCKDTITQVLDILPTYLDESVAGALDVQVWPNPAEDALTITCASPGSHPFRLELVNVLGQPVFVESAQLSGAFKRKVAVDQFPRGLYFLRLTVGDGSFVRKVVLE